MISVRMFTVLATVVALVLGLAACDSTAHIGWDLCEDDRDCPVTMRCDPATHLCVDCLEDEDCPVTMRCDRAPAICVDCLEDEDCLPGFRCIEKECVAIEEPPSAPASEAEIGHVFPHILGEVEVPDDINDVFNCDTGELAGPMKKPDIVTAYAASATTEISGTGWLTNVVGVKFASPLTQQTKVAIGFKGPEDPLPGVSQDGWYLDTSAQIFVILDIVPPETVRTSVRFFSDNQWRTAHPRLQASTDLIAVYLVVAWDNILAACPGFTPWDWVQAAWFAAASDRNSTFCDHVGLRKDIVREDVVPILSQYPAPQRVEEAQTPEEPTSGILEAIQALLGEIDEAWLGQWFPWHTLYPGVFDVFPRKQCEDTWRDSYGADSPYFVPEEILWVSDPGDWTWLIGEHSIRVSDTYTVTGKFPNQADPRPFHVAWWDGSLTWIMGCGEPLGEPLPPAPAPPPPEPAAAGGPITGYAPAGEPPDLYLPEASLLRVPDGVTDLGALDPTCGMDPTGALHVIHDQFEEWGRTTVNQENGALTFDAVPPGLYVLWYDIDLCAGGSFIGWWGTDIFYHETSTNVVFEHVSICDGGQ